MLNWFFGWRNIFLNDISIPSGTGHFFRKLISLILDRFFGSQYRLGTFGFLCRNLIFFNRSSCGLFYSPRQNINNDHGRIEKKSFPGPIQPCSFIAQSGHVASQGIQAASQLLRYLLIYYKLHSVSVVFFNSPVAHIFGKEFSLSPLNYDNALIPGMD